MKWLVASWIASSQALCGPSHFRVRGCALDSFGLEAAYGITGTLSTLAQRGGLVTAVSTTGTVCVVRKPFALDAFDTMVVSPNFDWLKEQIAPLSCTGPGRKLVRNGQKTSPK